MNTKSNFEESYMQINEQLEGAARALVSKVEGGALSLPAEIEGFRGFYLATSNDENIAAIAAISMEGVSYKIGTMRVSQ